MLRLITILLLVSAALIVVLIMPLELAGSTRIGAETMIRRPPAVVFDYVTTPANWPRWHPSSLAVSGAIDHSLRTGEQTIEDFSVAGHRGRVLWTVGGRDAPRRWLIDGRIEGGGEGMITYNLSALPDGTLFMREFEYRRPNLLFALLDAAYLRGRIEAESAEALRRLKDELEKQR